MTIIQLIALAAGRRTVERDVHYGAERAGSLGNGLGIAAGFPLWSPRRIGGSVH